jgi:hypothetical protein
MAHVALGTMVTLLSTGSVDPKFVALDTPLITADNVSSCPAEW